jgi:hypothetical protein
MAQQIEIERGRDDAPEVAESARAALAALRGDPDALAAASASTGLSEQELLSVEVEAEEPSAGVEPISTIIIVTMAGKFAEGAGKEAMRKIWDEVIRPYIRRHRGSDAVGSVRDPDE